MTSATDPLPAPTNSPGTSWWQVHAVWASLTVLPFLIAVAATWSTSPLPGQCSGISWGCHMDAAGAAGDTLLLYGPAIAAIWLAGHALITHVQRSRRRRGEFVPLPIV